jgi:hypothetical protein
MKKLEPWALGPFDLILHAEMHRLKGDDFDRRIAFISFDNSIEASITTYLTLNPLQRNGKQYNKEDRDKWLNNYHSKIDFFEDEIKKRNIQQAVEKKEIIWYHDIRNKQYHRENPGVPEVQYLLGIRKVSLWVFSVLFDVPDVEQLLVEKIEQLNEYNAKPERDPKLDRAVDKTYGMVEVAGQSYYTSELLFNVDHIAYREVGTDLISENQTINYKDEESQ